MNRINQISRKLLFCIKICADITSFVALVVNSKKYDRFQKSLRRSGTDKTRPRQSDKLVSYNLKTPLTRTISMRTLAGDLQMFYEVFFEKAYSIPVAKNNQPLTIVDAGSNIGLAAIFFLNNFEISRLICIEPDPSNAKLLRKNLQSEIPSGKAKVIEVALSIDEGSATWYQSTLSHNSHLQQPDENTSLPCLVKTSTIHSLINSENIELIDLLKIDIEGEEKRIFEDDLSWLSITKNIVIEIHDPSDSRSIPAILEANGFTVTKLKNNYSEVFFATRI